MKAEDPAAVAWATASGAAVDDVLRDWRGGQATEVPIGPLWDVLRVTTAVASMAIGRLHTDSVPLGPILEVQSTGRVDFLVRPGTAQVWPQHLRGTACTGRGVFRCPSPRITIDTGRQSGRRWLITPVPTPYCPPTARWTDDDVLCEAVAAAIYHSARLLPRQRQTPRAAI